jgi:hypothetical protein
MDSNSPKQFELFSEIRCDDIDLIASIFLAMLCSWHNGFQLSFGATKDSLLEALHPQ